MTNQKPKSKPSQQAIMISQMVTGFGSVLQGVKESEERAKNRKAA